MNDLGDPLIGLATASASTHRIRLGTAISPVPEHNPLLQAKQIATLDSLSSGRFVFGIGAGWLKEETEIMGGDLEHRWSQTREAVSAMKELWTKDEAEFHGRFYDFPPVRCSPKPIPETSPSSPPRGVRAERIQAHSGLGRRLDAHTGYAGTSANGQSYPG